MRTVAPTLVVLFVAARAGAEDAPASQPSKPGEEAKPTADEEAEAKKLAHAAQNPIANLISVPFELNFNGGLDPSGRTQTVFNLQPVLPIPIVKDYTLITRWILPFIGQPDAGEPNGTTWGFGDFNPQLYLAIQLPGGFMIGPGVTIVAPTASDTDTGLGKWSLGPSLVAVWDGGPWVVGVLVNNVWSVGGDDAREDVNAFFLQPFINYNLPKHTYLVTGPEILQNWEHSGWTVPIGGGVGQVTKLLDQPVNFSVQAYWNAATPDGGPDWLVKVQFQLLFPLPKKK